MVVFRMTNAGSRRHALQTARLDHRTGSDAVFVFQRAIKHIGNDFHVLMAVGVKPGTRDNAVFVDHPKRPPTHTIGIVIVPKRKGVVGIQPAKLRATTCFAI